ncbi:MAG: hypothetical protein FD180_2953 [Planctomycetota bacterium]|nr:MAG: hypothetical protein FD180_2953 [Planctomycetota bacterium]
MKRLFAVMAVAALAGCSGTYNAPPEPDEAPAPGEAEARTLAGWVVTLGDNDAEARNAAADELRKAGLAAGPWLFAGGVDADPERSAACRILMEELRRKVWEAAPPIDDNFAMALRAELKAGQPLRVFAWWWVALGSRLEDSRHIIADPTPYLSDRDGDVRRFAAILLVRLGHDIRKLTEILDEALADAVRSPGAFEQWEPVLASLAAAGFDEGQLLEVRGKLKRFLQRLENSGDPVPWWGIRAFFRRAGPGAEPLLASAILYEPPGELRRLAAISYGAGTQVRGELERAYGAKPDTDLAIALGNAGSPAGIKELATLLENSAPGSRDRWAASLALERGTLKWFGDAAEGDNTEAAVARWSGYADGRDTGAMSSFSCADGGAALVRSVSGLRWTVGVGPISKNMITRDEPGWAVFDAPAWDESCADMDLMLAWRLDRDRFLFSANGIAGGGERCDERAERMVQRAFVAARGGNPFGDAGGIKVPPVTEEALRAARAAVKNPATSELARCAALRRLSSGGDQDAGAIDNFLETKPSATLRRAAYLSLWQMDTEASLLALARRAGDTETKMDYQGIPDSAAPLLLRIRFRELGIERTDAAETDPVKWEALIREALK